MRRWWRSHSVRMRLTLWSIAAMVLVLGVYVAAVYVFVGRSLLATLDQQLRRDFVWASASIFQNDDGMFLVEQPDDLIDEEGLPWVQVWDEAARTLLLQNSEAQRVSLPASRELATRMSDLPVSVRAGRDSMRILTRRGSIGPTRVIIQVGRSESATRSQLHGLLLILGFGLPIAVVVAGAGGYTLARRALAPIERMTDRARHITAERLGDRLPVDNPDDELGRLATVFNQTLGRLEESFDQMRRFTADVSHELRTPLTAIRSVGEVGLRGHRDEAAFRGIIGSMLEEANRLASLVDRLLTLSRAETGQAPLTKEPIDVTALAHDVTSHLAVLAEEKKQTLAIDGEAGVWAIADRVVVRQALINLVDNAIKFSSVGGTVRVRVGRDGSEVIVDVIDSGAGISAAAASHIFDRFYRAADMSGPAGTGLGLFLAKGGVEATGGQLLLLQTGAAGSTFRITLPRA